MSLAALRAEIAECREWELRLHGGSKDMRDDAAIPGPWEWGLPLAMPIYALLAWRRGLEWGSEGWILIVPWAWLFSFGRLRPRALPGEWEAMIVPSRRSWLLARWSLRIPALLWLGACTLGWAVLLGMRDDPARLGPSPPVAAAILLAPFLLCAFLSWAEIANASFGHRSVLAPLLATVLGAGVWTAVVAFMILRGVPDFTTGIVAALLLAFGTMPLAMALPSWAAMLRASPGPKVAARVRCLLRSLVAGCSGVVPALALVVLLAGREKLLGAEGSHPILDRAILPASLIGTVLLGLDSLRLIGLADLGVEAPAPPDSVFTPARTIRASLPADSDAGRGLRAAAWALYRGRWRNLQHPRLLFLPKLLWECRAPACGFVAMLAPVILSVEGTLARVLGLWLTAVCLLLVPTPLNLPASRRLHLLGADFAAVARHNLVWGTLLAVIPATFGGAAMLLLGGRLPVRAMLGALLLSAGVLLLRQGPSAREAFRAIVPGRFPRIAVAVLAVAGLLYGWSVDGPTSLLVLGEWIFLLAAIAVVRDLRDPESAGRRLEAKAVDA